MMISMMIMRMMFLTLRTDDDDDDDVKTDPIVSYHKPKLERPETPGEGDSPMLKIQNLLALINNLSSMIFHDNGDWNLPLLNT